MSAPAPTTIHLWRWRDVETAWHWEAGDGADKLEQFGRGVEVLVFQRRGVQGLTSPKTPKESTDA